MPGMAALRGGKAEAARRSGVASKTIAPPPRAPGVSARPCCLLPSTGGDDREALFWGWASDGVEHRSSALNPRKSPPCKSLIPVHSGHKRKKCISSAGERRVKPCLDRARARACRPCWTTPAAAAGLGSRSADSRFAPARSSMVYALPKSRARRRRLQGRRLAASLLHALLAHLRHRVLCGRAAGVALRQGRPPTCSPCRLARAPAIAIINRHLCASWQSARFLPPMRFLGGALFLCYM